VLGLAIGDFSKGAWLVGWLKQRLDYLSWVSRGDVRVVDAYLD
jgi:hypothetical protein